MFNSPVDFLSVKIFSQITITDLVNSSAPYDHFRLLVYKMNNGGTETLVFTSEQFLGGTNVEIFDLVNEDEQDATTNKIGIVNEASYHAVIMEYDAGETISAEVDEFFLYVIADNVPTFGMTTCGALDSSIFSKFLYMLDHNTFDAEFNNAGGYTQQKIRRAYGHDLTEAEADELLENFETPEDTDVVFKSQTVVTTSDNGNELAVREKEIPVP